MNITHSLNGHPNTGRQDEIILETDKKILKKIANNFFLKLFLNNYHKRNVNITHSLNGQSNTGRQDEIILETDKKF